MTEQRRLVAYIRHGHEDEMDREIHALERHFTVVDSLDLLLPNDFVLPRFAYLPFADLMRAEVEARGAQLIQAHNQYTYVSDLRLWYADLYPWTFQTWFTREDVEGDGPFVVKGITNSRKTNWSTHCFAKDCTALDLVIKRLSDDPLLKDQPLCIRQYEPLRSSGVHPETGIPLSEEYRFFVYQGHVLSGGFYWSEHLGSMGFKPHVEEVPQVLLDTLTARIGLQASYYALDIARTESGEWKLVELGDGSMAGLAANDPDRVYRSLTEHLHQGA